MRASARKGTTFRYAISEAATVTFAIRRRARGRRVGGKCRRQTARNRTRKRCIRLVAAGAFQTAGVAGSNRKRFSGRIGKRALRPGSYVARVTARDAAGNVSRVATARFEILVHPAGGAEPPAAHQCRGGSSRNVAVVARGCRPDRLPMPVRGRAGGRAAGPGRGCAARQADPDDLAPAGGDREPLRSSLTILRTATCTRLALVSRSRPARHPAGSPAGPRRRTFTTPRRVAASVGDADRRADQIGRDHDRTRPCVVAFVGQASCVTSPNPSLSASGSTSALNCGL